MFAAYNNYPEELDILLGSNEFADPNICGAANETVRAKISLQCLQKRIIILEPATQILYLSLSLSLLSLSCLLDLVDCTNNPIHHALQPLMLAAQDGFTDVVDVLLKHGVDVDKGA